MVPFTEVGSSRLGIWIELGSRINFGYVMFKMSIKSIEICEES